jgi:ASC-1-like (ASCH) protein
MRIPLEPGIKRPVAPLRALRRGEKVTFAYKDEKVAVIAQTDQEEELELMRRHPIGKLWADRKDMDDPNEWRRARYRAREEG